MLCANLSQLPVGSSVEGLGTIHPLLNITTSTGNGITIAEGILPGAYQGPNDAPVPNYGINALNGFFDADKIHQYEYSFAPDVTVDYFSLKMLDYGDHNGLLTSEQAISLVGYDVNGNEVARDTLAFTNDPVINPRNSSAGDLWYTGDAATALEGEPGNYTFEVAGSGIASLQIEYDNDVSPGQPSDPHHGFALLCFEPEQSSTELEPPTAALTLLRSKPAPLIGGKFLVEYACSETAPSLVSATINGYDVVNGQDVNLVIGESESARIVDDMLIWLFAPEFSFDVTCADDNGNEVSTTVVPEFETP